MSDDAPMTKAGRLLLRSLTPREREVVVLLCAGLENGIIAERLGISKQVAKNYVRSVFAKSGIHTRAAFVIFAFRNGTVVCPCRRPHC